ncbi:MAG: DUF362 domain-containing protein [Candidatus Thorarchaeota archaeon]|nr:MAG: DUF362 domain-containing protein [Candidatus Thorarchaeota archaeon]
MPAYSESESTILLPVVRWSVMVKVAVVNTSPKTIFDDIARLMDLAEYQKYVSKDVVTTIKLNLSWSKFYPACSTNPYVLDGVLKKMLSDGYESRRIQAVENETVVTNIYEGTRGNNWYPVMRKHRIRFLPLIKAHYVPVKLPRKTLALEDIFGEVIAPKEIFGTNIMHLPTIKTHGHTEMTGALKDSFGLYLTKNRHLAHLRIHEVLVDLLLLQKTISHSEFVVTDGTIVGDGAGPRTMIPKVGNILLATHDMVAADTVQTRIMGIDQRLVRKLQLAKEWGLGESDPDKIEIVGDYESWDDLPNFHLRTGRSPVIAWNRGFLRFPGMEWLLFRSPLMWLPTQLSGLYHDGIWLPLKGKKWVKWFFEETEWGKLWQNYSE